MSFTQTVKNEICENDNVKKNFLLGEVVGLITTTCTFENDIITLPIDKNQIYIKIVHIVNLLFDKNFKNCIDDESIINKMFDTSLSNMTLIVKKELFKSLDFRKGFLTGAFLGSGYITLPTTDYHLEFRVRSYFTLFEVQHVLESFSLHYKVIKRKNGMFLYSKDSEEIADTLRIFSVSNALFEFEDTRILKEVRNNINRKVNMEVANLNKTLNSSMVHVKNINLIYESSRMTEDLKEIADLRLKHPELSLKELGELTTPVLTKNAVNYKMKQLEKIAKSIEGV